MGSVARQSTAVETAAPIKPTTAFNQMSIGKVLSESKRRRVGVHSKMPIRNALFLMAQEDVLSLPIYENPDKERGYSGIVNVFDLMAYIAAFVGPSCSSEDEECMLRRLEEPLQNALGISREGANRWTFNWDDPVEKVIDALSKGVHRVIIEAPDGNPANERILTQTDLISYIYAHLDSFGEVVNKPINSLGLYDTPQKLVQCTTKETALHCFQKLLQTEQQAMPIVDEKGAIVTTFSASDIRCMSALKLGDLKRPVLEYLHSHGHMRLAQQVTCKPTSTLKEIIQQMEDHRVHRSWIIDEEKRPIGVVSMTDVLCKFSRFDYKHPKAA